MPVDSNEYDCSKLANSHRRSICNGDIEINESSREFYLQEWKAKGYFGDKPVFVKPFGSQRNTNPTLHSKKPCTSCGSKRSRIVLGVGDNLKVIIDREMPGARDCTACKDVLSTLNSMTPEKVLHDIDSVAESIASNAKDSAPKLWQRLAIKADLLLDFGETVKRIKPFIVEACEVTKAEIAKRKKPQRTTSNRIRSAFRSDKRGKSRFITASQFQQDIKVLSGMIPSDITAIVGVARSGLSAATMISMYHHLPLLTIRQSKHDVIETGNGWRLGGNRHIDPSREKVVIVDDTVMTGNSLKAIKPLAKKEFGSFITASVYVNPLARVKPDIHAVDLPWAHLLEWNLFNSVLSPNMAIDFDGILCFDCRPQQDDDGVKYLDFINNAKPLYPARKVPIPLIVTARIEKYRKPTEQWLKRHGIRWRKLVMHPAKTLRERHKDDIAEYKAKHFMEWANRHRPKPPPLGFIESDDHQAKRIHQISKRMVICPSSGKVYE